MSAPFGFHRQGGRLLCDAVALSGVAQRFGTPLFVYAASTIRARIRELGSAFHDVPHRIHYAVKANGNRSLLRLVASEGVGFDVVSGGELKRLAAAGLPTAEAVFAGVGKEEWEIREALDQGILLFNVESEEELARINEVAASMDRRAPVALRLNPDVDAGTHRYITTGVGGNKFGIDLDRAASAVETARSLDRIDLKAYHFHLGSMVTSVEPYVRSLEKLLAFMDESATHREGIEYLDMGGGFGVRYRDEEVLDLGALGKEIAARLRGRKLTLILEPGRFLVAEAGLLLTRVLYRKEGMGRRFLVVDAGMTELIRPSLYGAWHGIEPVEPRQGPAQTFDVVGPICESADFLGTDRRMSEPRPGDLLAVSHAGAYGASMSSTYNSRRRAAEILVEGDAVRLARGRDTFEDLWRQETDS